MDKSQCAAVFQRFDRSTLVIAPPGYGKTYVMAGRISHLLQRGYLRPPRRILGLTFTNAAAGEMTDRVRSRVIPRLLDSISIMTFHSLSYNVLRAYGNYMGVNRDYAVVGEVQRSGILFELFEGSGVKLDSNWPGSTQEVQAFENWLKERILRQCEDFCDPNFEELFEDIYKQYIERLGVDSLDFMHILLYARKLFLEYPQVLELYRAAFCYILVDEFQDTNPLQFQLLKLLAYGHPEREEKLSPRAVFILADPNQAIYEFQGATPANVEKAKDVFDCDTVFLEKNYRTDAESIVLLSRALREDGDFCPKNGQVEKAQLLISNNPEEEAIRIVEHIQEYEGPLHEICVAAQSSYRLYPTRDLLEQNKAGLPYVFVPDFRSKDVERNYAPIFDSLTKLASESSSRGRLVTQVRRMCSDFKEDWESDEVLKILVSLAGKYDYKFGSADLGEKAREFANDIMLDINWGDLLRRNVRDKIFLSTIHGVKGLQFEQMHVCGLVNFEHIHSDVCWPCKWGKNRRNFANELEEPFRTLYVAITRAQNQLFLYATRRSSRNRQRRPMCLLELLLPFVQVEGLRRNEDIQRLLCGS
jgi:superfamily I DNA/RNA helicase